MKTAKLIDLIGQLSIVAGGLFYFILNKNLDDSFLSLYYLLGGWQLLSLFIHFWCTANWINLKERSAYRKTVLWTLLIGIASLVVSYAGVVLLFYFLYALLIVSPCYAIWYFTIGIREWKTIKRRELIHLK